MTPSSNNELLVQLRSLTDPNLEESTGIFFLEMCEGNVDMAAMLYKEQMGGGATAAVGSSRGGGGDAAPPRPRTTCTSSATTGTSSSSSGITHANSAGGRRRARATVGQIPADLDQSNNGHNSQNHLMNSSYNSSYNNGSFSGDFMAAAAISPNNGNGTRKMSSSSRTNNSSRRSTASNNPMEPVMEPGGGLVMARRDRGFANNVDLLGGSHKAEFAPFFEQGMASMNLEDAFMVPGAYNETATQTGLVTRTRLNSSYGSHNGSFNNSGSGNNLNHSQAQEPGYSKHNSAPANMSYDPRHYREPSISSPLHRPTQLSTSRLEGLSRTTSNNVDLDCRRMSTVSLLSEISDYNDIEDDERGDYGNGGMQALERIESLMDSDEQALEEEDSKMAPVPSKPDPPGETVNTPWLFEGEDQKEHAEEAPYVPDLAPSLPKIYQKVPPKKTEERSSGNDKDSKYGKGKRTPATKPGAVCSNVTAREPGHESFFSETGDGKLDTSETTQAATVSSEKHSKVRRDPAKAPGVVRVTEGEESQKKTGEQVKKGSTSGQDAMRKVAQEGMNESSSFMEPNSKIRRSPATQPGVVNVSSPTESKEPSRPSPASMQTNELNNSDIKSRRRSPLATKPGVVHVGVSALQNSTSSMPADTRGNNDVDIKARRRSPMASQPGIVHVTEPGVSSLRNSTSSMPDTSLNSDVDIKARRRSPMASQPGIVHVTEPGVSALQNSNSALQNSSSSMRDTSNKSEDDSKKRRVTPATMPGAVRMAASEPMNDSVTAATPALDTSRNSQGTISTEKKMRHGAPAQRPGAVSVSADDTEDPRARKEKTKGRGLGQSQQPEEVQLSVPPSGSDAKASSKDGKFANLNAKKPGAVSVTSSSDEDCIAKDKKICRRGRKKSISPNALSEGDDDAAETNAVNNDPSLDKAPVEVVVEAASRASPTLLPFPRAGRSEAPDRRTEGRDRSPIRAKTPVRDCHSPLGFPLAPAPIIGHPHAAPAPVVKKKKGFFSKFIKSKK